MLNLEEYSVLIMLIALLKIIINGHSKFMDNILMSCMHGWVTQRGVVLQGGNYEAICPGPYLVGSLLMHAVYRLHLRCSTI